MTFTILVLLTAFSVVIGNIIPHHHHHDESVICLADDLCCAEDCCESHHSAGDDCCSAKTNLTTLFGDSRKEKVHCDCDSGHHFHGGHLYVILAFYTDTWFSKNQLSDKTYEYPPYSNLYHSVLTEGHIGQRAPPVA